MIFMRIFIPILFSLISLIMIKPIGATLIDASIADIQRSFDSKALFYNKKTNLLIDDYNYSSSSQCSQIEDFSEVLLKYELDELNEAEVELRKLIKKYPMCADSRALLVALLWHKGLIGEAKSNWAAAFGLDERYSYKEWLVSIRHWPTKPAQDLIAFLDWIK